LAGAAESLFVVELSLLDFESDDDDALVELEDSLPAFPFWE